MNYKKILASIIEREATDWINELMISNQINGNALSESIIFEYDKESSQYLWEVRVRIIGQSNTVIVGGTVNDYLGIVKSVVWNNNKSIILWMASLATRQYLGITEFNIL